MPRGVKVERPLPAESVEVSILPLISQLHVIHKDISFIHIGKGSLLIGS